MPTFTLRERGYRDAWHGRDMRENDVEYMAGYEAGAGDTDRTRAGNPAPVAGRDGDAWAAAGSLLARGEK